MNGFRYHVLPSSSSTAACGNSSSISTRTRPFCTRIRFIFSGTRDDVEIEVGLQYNDGFNETMFSFVNGINTREGGTHLVGFRAALTKSINDEFKKSKLVKKLDDPLSGDDVREGLTAVLSVKVMDPQFEGQTKGKLGNSEVKGIVDGFCTEQLSFIFESNPDITAAILDKTVLAARLGLQPARPGSLRGVSPSSRARASRQAS
jgi:DNA gyrase subunit B